MAMETPRVQAAVVEAQEFPHLARAHAVRAVPKTIINGAAEALGALGERDLLQRVLTVVGQDDLLPADARAAGQDAPGGATTALGG